MQSRIGSAIETLINTFIGFIGSYLISVMVLNHFQAPVETTAMVITLLCTVWSIARGYVLRRIFNHKTANRLRQQELQ